MAVAECRSWEAVGPWKVSAVVGAYARRKVREPIAAPLRCAQWAEKIKMADMCPQW